MTAKGDISAASWWFSTFLIFLFGSFGAFFAVKEFGDPDFSDWIRPGPGHPLVGDAGRMLMFEAGPDGIQSKLLGVTANVLEGILLALGTVGMLLSPFQSNLAQFLTLSLLPLEGCYYLINIVYFPLVGVPEGAVPVFVMGGGLLAVCFWRLQTCFQSRAPQSAILVLNFYMAYFVLSFLVGIFMYYRSLSLQQDIGFFIQVRDHFMKVNNMTWSKGNLYPDGFQA